jgi:hypothetical protein
MTSILTQPADLRTARLGVPHHVVHRAFVTETVVLNLQTGTYHGLDPTAGRMLEALAGGEPVQEVAAHLAVEYGRPFGEMETDVLTLCGDLIDHGLLEEAGPGRQTSNQPFFHPRRP